MKKASRNSTGIDNQNNFKNKSNFRKAVDVLLVITALTFTAAYSFNPTPHVLAQTLFGVSAQSAPQSPVVNRQTNVQSPDVKSADDKKPNLSAAALTNGTLTTARRGHTATRLASGNVLIAGGDGGGTFEIFDPTANSSNGFGNLTTARCGHTATRLADGRVLIAGGTDANGAALASTEIYDPATDSVSAGAALNVARRGHTATVLADGRILIAGGDEGGSIEVYDAATDGFTLLEGVAMTVPRAGHSAVLMNDGRVFIAGGEGLDSAEIFNPADSTLTATGNAMAHHRTRAVLRVLPDGKVQIIGGSDDDSMEVYDPNENINGAHAHLVPVLDEHAALMPFDILNAPTRAALFHRGQPDDTLLDRENHSITELGNRVLVAGGIDSAGQTLNLLSILDSSGATVTTDKLDYRPGQTAVISGTGWQPGETVDIVLHEDPHTHTERRTPATADESGNFTTNYLVEEHDLRITFIVGAKGQSSGKTAQTTFTDASPGSLGNYATAGLSGTIVPTGVAPSNVAANVTFSNLTRGAGLAGVATTDAFNSSSWQTGSPLNISGNTDYYEFTITPNSCYQFSASELRIGLLRSGTGPDKAELRSSLDSYASAIGSVMNVTTSLSIFTVNLSGVSGLQNRASPVTFRLYGYNAGSTGGTLRIARSTSPPMAGVEVDGAVTSSSGTVSVSTNPTDQTTAFGGSATFSAAAANSTGGQWQVSTDGGTNFSNLSGETGTSLTVSNVTLAQNGYKYRAVFSSSCGTAATSAATLTVNKRSTSTSLSLTGGTNPSVYGDSLTFTASVGGTGAGNPSGGSVEFFDGATSLGTQSLSGGAASVTTSALTAGAHSIAAVFTSSDVNFNGSASGAVSQTVGRATPTITWNNPADITYGTALGAAQLNGLASVGGNFNYTPASGTLLDAGNGQNLHVDFTPTDTANYNNAAKDVSINVLKASTTVVVTCPANVIYTGAAQEPCSASVAGPALNQALMVTYSNNTNAGLATANASYAESANYLGSRDSETFAIDKASSSTVVSGGGTFTFNGLPHPASVSVTGAGGLNLNPSPVYGGNCGAAPVAISDTPCTASYIYPGDANHYGSNGSTVIKITLLATTTSVTVSPTSQQYSDSVTFTATITPGLAGAVPAATGVIFYVGTQAMNSTPVALVNSGGNLTATLVNAALLEPSYPGNGQMAPTAPGTRSVTAVFSGVDPNFAVNSATTPLTVTPEDARVNYTGALFASTASAASGAANVTLSATVQDITAADAGGDPNGGDIRNAKVTFINADTNIPLTGCSNLSVGLVNASDTKVGTATCQWSADIGNNDSVAYTIGIIVSNYYNRNNPADDTVVTISKPLGTNFITGGGYLLLQTPSGLKAGDVGSKSNFGFNVKYNKSGTNLQGSINTIIRRTEGGVLRVYQIKGNSMTSLTVRQGNSSGSCSTATATNPCTAYFNGKANIQDITNPLAPVSVDGNATLQVVMTDKGEPGSADTIGITVWNKTGGLWLASRWSGSATAEQILGGGNLVVH